MFHSSKYGSPTLVSRHVNHRQPRGNETFELDAIKNALLRVCVRNSLCIHEKCCSKKVGLHPGKRIIGKVLFKLVSFIIYLLLRIYFIIVELSNACLLHGK